MSGAAESVFVNCPFDDEYKPLFEAVVFCVMASGYRVRCALEENDAADIRLEKLYRLIRASGKSVHDLSRVKTGASGLPRFNMPFELGLFMGAAKFGSKPQRTKSALIMVTEPYRLPVYLSDLGGNDPTAHFGQCDTIIEIVRRYLHVTPAGEVLRTGRIEQETESDIQGNYAFAVVEPGSYVVEMVMADGTIIALSNAGAVARYETLQTVVQLPGRWNVVARNVEMVQKVSDFVGLSSALTMTATTLTMAVEQNITPLDPGEPVSP